MVAEARVRQAASLPAAKIVVADNVRAVGAACHRINQGEALYIINSVRNCISSTQSVVYHQAARVLCTLKRDEIQGRLAALDDIHDCVVMIYQACGLDKKRSNFCLPKVTSFLVEARGVEPLSESVLTRLSPGAVKFQDSRPDKALNRLGSLVESSCVGGATLTRRTDAT